MKTILKSSVLAVALVGLLCSRTPDALAQSTPDQSQGKHPINITNQVAHIASRLQLNDQQQGQLLEAMQAFAAQRKVVFADTGLSQQEKRAKMEEVRKTFITSVSAFLTPDQVKELEKMVFGQHGRRGGEGNQGAPGTEPPAPPQ